VFILQQLDEIVEELLVQGGPNFHSQRAILVQLFKGVLLLLLELVKVDVDPWSLYCLLLAEVSVLEVVTFHRFSLRPGLIVDVVDAVAEAAVLLGKHAKASDVKPAEGPLAWELLKLLLDGLLFHGSQLIDDYKTYSLIAIILPIIKELNIN
jgi:hypothetical protein